ncbi:hypothetical protein E3P99_03265 [Wallemia hederae]|uniref:Uncharacterized protein n=1 Tax=Wallemia hederae TaxID=1540922 RepID=A0A4T0FG76_9BASI|nr:hypothetical protein E3P99_03265 [Wallemia hederae]
MFKKILALASVAALIVAAPLPSADSDKIAQLVDDVESIKNITSSFINHKRTVELTIDVVNGLGTSEDFMHAISGFEQLDDKLEREDPNSCVDWTTGLIDQLRIAFKGCVDNINASDQSQITINADDIAASLAGELSLLVKTATPTLDALLKADIDVAGLVQPLDAQIKALIDLLDGLIPGFSVKLSAQLKVSGHGQIATLLDALLNGQVGGFLSGLVSNVGGVLGGVLNMLGLGGGLNLGGMLGGGLNAGVGFHL